MNTRPQQNSLFLQIVLIGGFIFIALVLFALARSIYRDSFQVGRYIDQSQEFVDSQKDYVGDEQSELTYAQTPQYQEKIAKSLLGRKMPGEEVIILSDEEQNIDALVSTSAPRSNDLKLLSPPQKWLRYFFGI